MAGRRNLRPDGLDNPKPATAATVVSRFRALRQTPLPNTGQRFSYLLGEEEWFA